MQEKRLRSGFTTGTCGAAAAKAAAVCLLSGEIHRTISIMTPKGINACLETEPVHEDGRCFFRVQKDAGDDPDVTDRAFICACVSAMEGEAKALWYQSEQYPRLYLTGGIGVGMVTRQGLACPVGKHAINPVPRQMIFDAVQEVCETFDYSGCLLIQIWIPQGVELADKTFNPKLGIEGGISVLGTSGIVEPMSEQALTATIELEIHMKAVAGEHTLIITPGNYGEAFLREHLGLPLDKAVKCSNFIADTMACLEREGMKEVLLVGHLGKLIKVAGGVPNTHSRYGDRRMEILADCLDEPGSGLNERILTANTTEEAVGYLKEAELTEQVMTEVTVRIKDHLERWSHGKVRAEVVTFSTVYGILGKSMGANALIKKLTSEET